MLREEEEEKIIFCVSLCAERTFLFLFFLFIFLLLQCVAQLFFIFFLFFSRKFILVDTRSTLRDVVA